MKGHALTVEAAYREMSVIRNLEEAALQLGVEGIAAGSLHMCFGQEAIPVGATAALRAEDRVLSTYRGHGWAVASGAPVEGVLAEIAQRAGGVNGGRAGSPLLSHPSTGFMGENSIVGAGVPIAAGVALAAQVRGESRVVLTAIGDGAMNQGSVTEGLVFAAAKSLPLIVVVENNGWAEMTATSHTLRGPGFVARAEALGIPGIAVDGTDPFAVRDAVAIAADRARVGDGPTLIECVAPRLRGHYNRDIQHYRPKQDLETAAAKDPIPAMRAKALEQGWATAEMLDAIADDAAAEIADAVGRVRVMPPPDAAAVLDHVYGVPATAVPLEPSVTEELTYWRALNQALESELEARPEMILYGEDVAFAGGIFGVTRNLQKRLGADRVFDTPISESAILGSAVGAAMAGMRPVVEIMWADFVFVALDQIINQASNVRYINRSEIAAPLTIRMQQGTTPGSCAQHSQSIEAILAHIPGIRVGLPATAGDAYEMLRAAIADPDPVVLIEHRSLYQTSGIVHVGAAAEVGGARCYGDGEDVGIITWGQTLQPALDAASVLADEGVNASVLDLRWIRPLDTEAIDRLARSCTSILIVHEASEFGGFGAEVAAGIAERVPAGERGRVSRLGAPAVRMPSAPSLQSAVLPTTERIVSATRDLVRPSQLAG